MKEKNFAQYPLSLPRKEGESALKQETNVERERKGAQEKREAKRKRLEEQDNADMDDNRVQAVRSRQQLEKT
jgi:hypothetical protein